MSEPSKDATRIVMVGASEQASKLAVRVLSLGIEPVPAADLDEACDLLTGTHADVQAALVPTDVDLQALSRAVQSLTGSGRELSVVTYGRRPIGRGREALRGAGIRLALWEPYDDATLRFQLNRAITHDPESDVRRRQPRVPTYLLARIAASGRTKDAVVYSLSPGGAFLETPRPSMPGARVDVEIRLPSGPVPFAAHVIFANVPGNLQRENLPLGMGVVFDSAKPKDTATLEAYIHQRLEDLSV